MKFFTKKMDSIAWARLAVIFFIVAVSFHVIGTIIKFMQKSSEWEATVKKITPSDTYTTTDDARIH